MWSPVLGIATRGGLAVGRIIFVNPNEPEQPARGVYRWFCRDGSGEFTLYVGCAGGRRLRVSAASTLKRGIFEAQRSCLSSDKGLTLDTDFIVGSAIRYFKSKGFDCCWEHVSDEPSEEMQLCGKYQPLLQDATGNIKSVLKYRRPEHDLWKEADLETAESKINEWLGQNS
jgi:hypothetical protein